MNLIELLAEPWALSAPVFQKMTELFIRHAQGSRLSDAEIDAAIEAQGSKSVVSTDRREMVVDNGVAIVPVHGIIAKHSSMVNRISQPQGSSTDGIREHLRFALADPDVRAILFDIDSPGGTVGGVDELAAEIFDARGRKPMDAMADQMASAAYWIGSAADRILATRTSSVGSIGVYSALVDLDRALKNQGINVELVSAGEGKTDGHPWEALTKRAVTDVREQVDEIYGMFIGAVSSHRKLSAEKITGEIKAKSYSGREALSRGLVDQVVSGREAAINLAIARAGGSTRAMVGGATNMSSETKTDTSEPTAGVATPATPTAPAATTAAALPAAKPALRLVSDGHEEARTEERQRCQQIDKLAVNFPDHSELLASLKDEGVSIEEVNRQLLAAEGGRKAAELKVMGNHHATTLGAAETQITEFAGDPKSEEYWVKRYETDKVLQEDFGDAKRCATYMTEVAPKLGYPKKLAGVEFPTG